MEGALTYFLCFALQTSFVRRRAFAGGGAARLPLCGKGPAPAPAAGPVDAAHRGLPRGSQ